eukprot:SAG25_NODE_108_length_15257_cov_63.784404_10_plen_280_part_00
MLFPNVPVRMMMQPHNLLSRASKNVGPALGSAASKDPRRVGSWDKVVLRAPPSATKFEIKQLLSKVYGLDVQKVNTLNAEGKTTTRMAGRKQYKFKRFADYKKAYVKVARVKSHGLEPNDDGTFQIPLLDGHIPNRDVGKFKRNQEKWTRLATNQLEKSLDIATEVLQHDIPDEDVDEVLQEALDKIDNRHLMHHQQALRRVLEESDTTQKLGMIAAIRRDIQLEKRDKQATVVISSSGEQELVMSLGPAGGGEAGRAKKRRARKGRGKTGKRQTGRPR